MEFQIGETVTAIYKTGKYIGEISQIRDQHYVVRIKAILKHPQQGDLHNPNQVDVPFFHERKALAFHEQANIPKKMVHLYKEDIPDYKASLKQALQKLMDELSETDTHYSTASLNHLHQLQKEYFPN
ncbi:kinase [Priestia megaterium]|nr:kinase [Priestia megaterium]